MLRPYTGWNGRSAKSTDTGSAANGFLDIFAIRKYINVEEDCPTCFGTGKIKSSILFTDQLESKIDRLVNKIGITKLYLHVHPYVAAYINQGVISMKRRWQMKYGFGVHVIPSQKLAFLQYEFYDAKHQFIDMKEEIETKK